MEIKDYILAEADRLFYQFGFKSVTMDDIAKHLGMSKKTIYQHFQDKDELVNLLIKQKLDSQVLLMEQCHQKAQNAIEEIFMGIANVTTLLSHMNPRLFFDLQKYHPNAWLYFVNFKEKRLRDTILRNLERGKDEGFYRPEIQTSILLQLRLEQIDILFSYHDQYNTDTYNIAQAMTEITIHFLYGISNLRGIDLIEYYKPTLTQLSS